MHKCSVCSGTGVEEFEGVENPCFHCENTGMISDQMHFHDQRKLLAEVLALNVVCEMRKIRNEDPGAEGWDFCAAENMLSTAEYFEAIVQEQAHFILNDLKEMSIEESKILIAWMCYNER